MYRRACKTIAVFAAALLCACGSGPADGTSYLSLYTVGGGTGTISFPTAANVTHCAASNVGPLECFFDLTGLNSTVQTSHPFLNVSCTWDFGDTGAGTWGDQTTGSSGTGANTSRNAATGLVAAHVYMSAGTYTPVVTCNDGTTTNAQLTLSSITVTNPDTYYSTTATTCISTSGTFTGCPSGATQVTSSSFTTAISTYLGTNKRVLFRGGETFTGTASFQITGPWTIGSYGTGKAIISNTTGTSITIPQGSAGFYPSDGRIMDLEMTAGAGQTGRAINVAGNMDDLLFLRLNIHDVYDGINAQNSCPGCGNDVTGNTHTWQHMFVQDVTVQNITAGAASATHGLDLMVSESAILGNSIDNNGGGEHTFRSDHCDECIFNHNYFAGTGSGKELFALRSTAQNVGNSYYFPHLFPAPSPSQYNVISDNLYHVNPTSSATGLLIGPTADSAQEAYNDIVIERNKFLAVVNAESLVQWNSTYTVARDNIFDMSTMSSPNAILLTGANGGGTLVASHASVYNNTFYTSAANTFSTVRLVGGADYGSVTSNTWDSVAIQNNIVYAPLDSALTVTYIYSGSGSFTNLTADHNTGNVSTLTTCPKWATDTTCAGTPSAIADFKIDATSPYASTGTSVPSWYDALEVAWSGTWDIGAVKH